jgi:hypothetical protein
LEQNSDIFKESNDFHKDTIIAEINDFEHYKNLNDAKVLSYILPLLLICFLLLGFSVDSSYNAILAEDNSGFSDFNIRQISFNNKTINILSESDLSSGIKDTVYTDKECWLELRIDQQMLYQYWRNGKIEKYAVSTGNKYLEKGIESRPGLFAIFHKEEHHQSSQFDNADMYFFMPFNMGIGFHSLNGTGYYGTLGVRPVSHGCIRMRHEDVKKLFKDCPLGTLVLGDRGYSSRAVAFAPKDYKNTEEYSKDQYKFMLAENLYNILEGNYYLKERKFFIIDPKIIPVSGIYISYDKKIPEKQKLPNALYVYKNIDDRLIIKNNSDIQVNDEYLQSLTEFIPVVKEVKHSKDKIVNPDEDLIKNYFHNPIGILPYFPPDK